MKEQRQYRYDLLEWCQNLYANWELTKPRLSQIFDLESLEEWEGSCLQLQEMLQTDQEAGIDEYQSAKHLFEHWERMSSVLNAYEDVENRSELDDHAVAEHVETEVEVDHDMEIKLSHSLEESLEKDDSPEEMESGMNVGSHSPHENSFDTEIESDHHVEFEESHRYRDELLTWCLNMYSNWENMKPRFSKLFDMESLKEWEGSCLQLKEKLEADGNADSEDYQTAINLFEQYQNLMKETYAYQET
ncbi:hypothetical protein QE429_004552 [Bacillus sp. SORGH_AS 510]|uniref:hypothetical protein n=1 Tax=Bacillus sp. SORGH_AS_0510 TaxID=3041771 RepID=UPI002782A004|nr:hypothetical protein [Bacillus sp. SORGH_AS_0510]MDQ1147725.1 hypothetical protein [Bacillus sp. SORGH_AS_0510]